MAISSSKNVKNIPTTKLEAEERLCAPTVYTAPLSSFTLMPWEPEEGGRKIDEKSS